MSEIDFEARQRILKLEDRICELQAILLLTLSEMRALREMSTILWEHQQVRVDKTRDISTVLDSMREENLETLLASFADKDMKVASQLKQNIDKLRKK